jgi:hypothetical protein
MKNAYIMLILLVAGSLAGCKHKDEVEPLYPFYQTIGGDSETGKDWELAHFYFLPGISNYDNVAENGYDGVPDLPEWAKDNYYTFFKDGYGLCTEIGVINPWVHEETAESWDRETKAYKYIQFDYSGGKTVHIVNRVQKPAFFGDWEIISLKPDELVIYQQDKEFDQEFVIVLKSRTRGI